ncbi:hypothetical protein ACFXHA_39145 [Nocardia sp. NPDC059240]|uniref:hypothetical protein n=1 Tax=Nocardia sp. NPDC059240 TaxID=3346786 RepID=UPI003685173D
MKKPSRETIRGHVLEELLARLLQRNGYRLLVAADQDPEALKDSELGLLVRGRGADHQVDVLGELDLPLPFSLPIRLFVEAKYRKAKTGLPMVRNASGTLHDVNETFGAIPPDTDRLPLRRYHYRYALFSASGFTTPAQQFALAHQISLVDLSNPGFAPLLTAADDLAAETVALIEQSRVSRFPLRQFRTALRHVLGTWPASVSDEDFSELSHLISNLRPGRSAETVPGVVSMTTDYGVAQRSTRIAESLNGLRDQSGDGDADDSEGFAPLREFPTYQLASTMAGLATDHLGSLVLGFPPAAFVLVLVADDSAAFDAYLSAVQGTDVRVHLEFAERHKVSRDWVIVPADGSDAFRLRFTLPELLAKWMFEGGVPTWSIRDIKATMFSSIALFRANRVIRLVYEPHAQRT